jgi:hypothetical protein
MNRSVHSLPRSGAHSGGLFLGIEERMRAKTCFPTLLVLAVLGLGTAQGQTPYSQGTSPEATSTPAVVMDGAPAQAPPNGGSIAPPAYVTYHRPDCCGPIGGDGAIMEELFVRAGVSVPISGPIFGHTLETGWMVTGGGRTLFYDPDMLGAWAVEIGITNIYNHGQRSDIRVPLSILVPSSSPFGSTATRVNFGIDPGVPGVTIKNLNRTSADLGLGREIYLTTPATAHGIKWRAGLTAGIRYGSERVEFEEIRHRTGVFETPYLALHTDVECPCCSVVFLAGFRAEWDWTFSNVLQNQNDADVMDVNFLLTAGVRF